MTTEDLAKEHTVTHQPVVISLPISDRRTSWARWCSTVLWPPTR